MPLHKTAIAIPEDLLAAVDRAARARHETRNRFVTRVLQEAVRARRDAEVTRRLNELFAEPDEAEELAREAAELDAVGTGWNDESWGSARARCIGWSSDPRRARRRPGAGLPSSFSTIGSTAARSRRSWSRRSPRISGVPPCQATSASAAAIAATSASASAPSGRPGCARCWRASPCCSGLTRLDRKSSVIAVTRTARKDIRRSWLQA